MQINKLNNEISVSPQISLQDISHLKEQGFKTIICNRPDNESEGQIEMQHLNEAAKNHGINFISQPVISGAVSDEQVLEFKRAIAGAEKPVLAFCRTGTRCSILWALSMAGAMPAKSILEATSQAGYELPQLQEKLELASTSV